MTLRERIVEALNKSDCEHYSVVEALVRAECARELREAARNIEVLQPSDESGKRFVEGFFAATDEGERILLGRADALAKGEK